MQDSVKAAHGILKDIRKVFAEKAARAKEAKASNAAKAAPKAKGNGKGKAGNNASAS